MRHSAAAASVMVFSVAAGFGLGSTMLTAKEANSFKPSTGPGIVSPAKSRENTQTRSISGFKGFTLATRSISLINSPAINAEGPQPGIAHTNLGPTRSLLPACLMAMN